MSAIVNGATVEGTKLVRYPEVVAVVEASQRAPGGVDDYDRGDGDGGDGVRGAFRAPPRVLLDAAFSRDPGCHAPFASLVLARVRGS